MKSKRIVLFFLLVIMLIPTPFVESKKTKKDKKGNIPIVDGAACEAYMFNASSIDVVRGTLDAGNLASTYVIDGDWYNVSELNNAPGLDIRFNFTYVPENITCGCIEIYKTYTGHSQHDIQIQAWNFTSTSWKKIGKALFNETVDWVCIGLGHSPEYYLSGGEMWFRFYHPLAGHIKHTLHIERIDLRVVTGAGLTIVLNPIASLFPGLAIGISLFIIAAAYYYIQRR